MLVAASIDEGVAMVRLTDGAHRNVLSPAMSVELERAVLDVVKRGARALVLSADPPVFCAGGSLDSLLERSVSLTEVYRGFVALASAPIPTVAAVAGAAIGAGVNLALCCDVILTAPSARFDPRFLDVGIHPGADTSGNCSAGWAAREPRRWFSWVTCSMVKSRCAPCLPGDASQSWTSNQPR